MSKLVALLTVGLLFGGCSDDTSVGTSAGVGGGGATGGAEVGGGGATGGAEASSSSSGGGGSGGSAACAFVEDGACLTVTRLEAGGLHSCAVVSDGSLRCWGSNEYGQLGDPAFDEPMWSKPRVVPGLVDVVDIALGFHHSCVLLVSGEVWCWGRNPMGQVGDGSTSAEIREPTQALDGDVVDIDARFTHTCAVRSDGSVWCWGFALDGQGWQGGREDGSPQPSPMPVGGTGGANGIGSVASGGSHACAASVDMKRVYCWGNNTNGRLGDGTTNDSATAVKVGGATAPDADIAALTVGSDHACTLSADRHELWCWGPWSWMDPLQPQVFPALLAEVVEPVAHVSSGWRHTCFAIDSGEVRCWGENAHLQLGVSNAAQPREVPVVVEGLPPAEVLSVGRNHSCIVADDASLWCWGRNDFGQLGAGFSSAGASGPVAVTW